jgi:hypothetical protein
MENLIYPGISRLFILETYSLKGKVISEDKKPLQNYHIIAYDHDNILNPDDLLGEALTDSLGLFRINFDSSKFVEIFELLEGPPDVYLIIKNERGEEVLKTGVMSTQKEIEYHIKVSKFEEDPNHVDLYAGNARRFIGTLNEVGNIIGLEQRINLDILTNTHLSQEVRNSLSAFVSEYEERRNNFQTLLVTLASLVDSYSEELKIGNIGYDGPQVPRHPGWQPYEQVIVWPRKEEFKWA